MVRYPSSLSESSYLTRTAYIAPYLSLAYLAYLSYLILGEAWNEKSRHRQHICPRVKGTNKDRIQATTKKTVGAPTYFVRMPTNFVILPVVSIFRGYFYNPKLKAIQMNMTHGRYLGRWPRLWKFFGFGVFLWNYQKSTNVLFIEY